MFFSFAMETMKITNFVGNCQWNSSLHRFNALIFFSLKSVKAMEANSESDEAMKR
jgi:hypothetical protein